MWPPMAEENFDQKSTCLLRWQRTFVLGIFFLQKLFCGAATICLWDCNNLNEAN